ncbi:hypothetical protein AVEN_168833-1 [Araneus ventricosus]|uniref:Uncharacterized protein n=1 Tax=Araneus ventricosus TaxID=182803 RepID=A0A4Y2S4G3_ARAVE|nr:hypothetical protein AVEN_168833-1 [Araneus ventricosus]
MDVKPKELYSEGDSRRSHENVANSNHFTKSAIVENVSPPQDSDRSLTFFKSAFHPPSSSFLTGEMDAVSAGTHSEAFAASSL